MERKQNKHRKALELYKLMEFSIRLSTFNNTKINANISCWPMKTAIKQDSLDIPFN